VKDHARLFDTLKSRMPRELLELREELEQKLS
jgi:hypothetical protein